MSPPILKLKLQRRKELNLFTSVIATHGFHGIIVVHPWSALQAYNQTTLDVGVFNNVKRETGEFETTELYVA